jgi:peptidoglycan-associated lipoprotein
MNRSSTFQLTGHVSIALICAALTACATTQRSSTSGADQAATPPAAVSTENAGAAPSSAEPVTQAATPAVPPPGSSATARADEGGPMEFPHTNRDSASETKSAEQASELKQKLDEQDAEINKIRQRQETEAATMDKETVREATAASHAETTPAVNSAAAPGKESAAAPRKEEDAVVFPERKNTAGSATQTRSSIPKPVERSVYFNYDEASVLARYDAMLLANAAYLKEHSGADVEVEGNCDERGSREYNLALGARRAEQVKRALEAGGVESGRIHTLSFGKEKPIALGQDEESYSKNRRADIVY